MAADHMDLLMVAVHMDWLMAVVASCLLALDVADLVDVHMDSVAGSVAGRMVAGRTESRQLVAVDIHLVSLVAMMGSTVDSRRESPGMVAVHMGSVVADLVRHKDSVELAPLVLELVLGHPLVYHR